MRTLLKDHIWLIGAICDTFGWNSNRIRQYHRAANISREIEADLKLQLTKLDIVWE